MPKKIDVQTIKQIRKKVELGDFVLLGKLMGVSHPACRMRFLRGDVKAVEAMQSIIKNREKLIKEYQSKYLMD